MLQTPQQFFLLTVHTRQVFFPHAVHFPSREGIVDRTCTERRKTSEDHMSRRCQLTYGIGGRHAVGKITERHFGDTRACRHAGLGCQYSFLRGRFCGVCCCGRALGRRQSGHLLVYFVLDDTVALTFFAIEVCPACAVSCPAHACRIAYNAAQQRLVKPHGKKQITTRPLAGANLPRRCRGQVNVNLLHDAQVIHPVESGRRGQRAP